MAYKKTNSHSLAQRLRKHCLACTLPSIGLFRSVGTSVKKYGMDEDWGFTVTIVDDEGEHHEAEIIVMRDLNVYAVEGVSRSPEVERIVEKALDQCTAIHEE